MVNCRKGNFLQEECMKKRKSIGLCVGICLLLLGILDVVNVFAAVTEGKAGETLTGEYAVIINTDTSDSRSTGTLIFDDSGSTASVSFPQLKAWPG